MSCVGRAGAPNTCWSGPERDINLPIKTVRTSRERSGALVPAPGEMSGREHSRTSLQSAKRRGRVWLNTATWRRLGVNASGRSWFFPPVTWLSSTFLNFQYEQTNRVVWNWLISCNKWKDCRLLNPSEQNTYDSNFCGYDAKTLRTRGHEAAKSGTHQLVMKHEGDTCPLRIRMMSHPLFSWNQQSKIKQTFSMIRF